MEDRNLKAFRYLRDLGYPIPNIRRGLHKITGISQPDMARILGVSRQNITLHINGNHDKPYIQEGIALIWQIPRGELFPPGVE